MKWLFSILVPFWVQAQNLKPGVYRDLKVGKPIVLDTGRYTFINLQMKNLGKGIWLDGVRDCKSQTADAKILRMNEL